MGCTTEVRLGPQLDVLPPGFRIYKTCLLLHKTQIVSKKQLSTLFLILHKHKSQKKGDWNKTMSTTER